MKSKQSENSKSSAETGCRPENALELHDVSYYYPHASKPSLKAINFTVQEGKFIGVMGPTGAGKTTLSLCLNGLIPQLLEGKLTGRISAAGLDVRKTPVQFLAKTLGLVLQDSETQIIGRTVEEDTAFGPRNFLIPSEEIQRRVNQTLAKVRLQGYNQRLTQELSGGEKQRLAIAGVLVIEPEILVLDEPTSELDPVGRAEIYATLDNLRRQKELTILLVDHSSEELLNKADEIIVLKQGEIVWHGFPTELFRNIPLMSQYGIKPLPVSLIGWALYEKGWISFDEIPLEIPAAELLLRNLGSKYGLFNHSLGLAQDCKSQKMNSCQTQPAQKVKAVEIRDLIYQYNSDQPVLRGINLAINVGEFVALIGQNGAGKTTLAKHLNGLLKPTSGEVVVEGLNTLKYDIPHLAKTIGYVFQNPDHQIFSVTVEKELEYGLKNAGFKDQEIKERVDQVLKITGLEPYRQVHPYTLGKGERQMIAVASILVMKPKLLVVDEPTTGSDWTGVQTMMTLIKQLHLAGTTIVMISHDMDLVAQYAQRVIVLNDGNIVLDGCPREVFSQKEALLEAAIVPPQLCRLSSQLDDVLFQETLLEPAEFLALFDKGREVGR